MIKVGIDAIDSGESGMRIHLVWATCVMVVGITAGSVALAWRGADTSIISTIISLVSTLATILLYGQVSEVKQQVQAVKEQTNGNTTMSQETIRAQLEAMHTLLASRMDKESTAPADPYRGL